MIYTSKDNWYCWSYDNISFGKQLGGQEFKTHFSKITRPVDTFKKELSIAASDVLEVYPNLKPEIFFSGGADSELLLRGFLDIGYKPSVYIVRYENDFNIYDVSYAITICSILNVGYKIIDFNLEKFYENDAESISEISQIDRPRALPYCQFLNLVDGLPILGASDITALRTTEDYSYPGEWKIRCWEHDIGWSKYARSINRPAIPEWFKWTPELVASFSNLKWFNKLISDNYHGKLGTNSTKLIGYKEAFPDMIYRVKKTGFEQIDHLVLEFEKHLEKKYNGLPYRNFFDRSITEFSKELYGTV
jgi:hypothetical protein